ncbi:MAG: DUF348 domain-containing protein [Prevotellaceae bacterium]|nr:DUF348 domain-containing protein [Candidatus Faecinaster equi]
MAKKSGTEKLNINDENQVAEKTAEQSEQEVKEKIKAVLEAQQLDEEQRAKLEEAEKQRAETRKKIEAVLEVRSAELESAAEAIAPEFDYEAAAEEVEVEEALEDLNSVFGIELYWKQYEEDHMDDPLPPAEVSPSKYPREKYVAKTAIGRWIHRDCNNMVIAACMALLLIVVAWQTIDYAIPETVNVTYQTLKEMKTEKVKTRTRTVGEFVEELKANGYEIDEQDAVTPSEEAFIKNELDVRIMKATKTKARIAGTTREIFMIPGTVEENLNFNGIKFDDDDEIKPALDKTVKKDTMIVLDEVHYTSKDKTEKVEPVSRVILDPELTSGVEQREEGNSGKGVFTYKSKYVNGKKVKTTRKVKKWYKEAHDNVLRLGTSSTGNTGEYIVVRTFIANCTAYTARPGAHGSLGESVHVGTCAVDPGYVPYRSSMWIDGYGYAYANDCGGAVKGNVVDLYMNSTSACIQWGRRNCTAYILQPVE